MIVSLIITLIVVGFIWWLIKHIPQPSPINSIVDALFIILVILYVLSAFGVIPNMNLPHIKL